jgi:hypothetical protein
MKTFGGGASYKTLGASDLGPNVPFQLFSSGKNVKAKNEHNAVSVALKTITYTPEHNWVSQDER